LGSDLSSLAFLVNLLGVNLEELADIGGRLRVQRAVFLLRSLGVEPFMRYDFYLFRSNPYSQSLSKDCYLLALHGPEDVRLDFIEGEILRDFASHSEEWIDVASRIVTLWESHPRGSLRDILSLISISRPGMGRGELEGISRELERMRAHYRRPIRRL